MAIKLFTDSTAYLPQALVDQHHIGLLELSVNFDDASFYELDRNYDAFYEKLKLSPKLPTSSQPIMQKVTDAFEDAFAGGNDIIVVMLSSHLSGTLQTATMIGNELVEKYPDRRFLAIDSLSTCMELGYAALSGADAIKGNLGFDEVVEAIYQTMRSTRFLFKIETLENLIKGGRIGKAQGVIGSLLNIKPILTVNEGKTDAVTKVRTSKKALKAIADMVVEDVDKYGFRRAVMHHINNLEGVEFLKSCFEGRLPIDHIIDIGPVIGTHVGPGAVGIVYETLNPMRTDKKV